MQPGVDAILFNGKVLVPLFLQAGFNYSHLPDAGCFTAAGKLPYIAGVNNLAMGCRCLGHIKGDFWKIGVYDRSGIVRYRCLVIKNRGDTLAAAGFFVFKWMNNTVSCQAEYSKGGGVVQERYKSSPVKGFYKCFLPAIGVYLGHKKNRCMLWYCSATCLLRCKCNILFELNKCFYP